MEEEGYYKAHSTPGHWQHTWHPVQFCLIANNFGIEYVGIEHFNHLLTLLKKYHQIQTNMAGDKIVGINVQWDFPGRRVRIDMQTYIDNLLLTLNWPRPRKPQLSPFIATPIAYGKKTQLTLDEDRSALLSPECLQRVQKILGSLVYYARAVDNKLLVALNAIASRQSKATVHMEQLVHTLLDYVATYPNDGIIYRASNMVLCAHADTSYLNETKSRSRARAHIYLSEDDPIPHLNGAVLTIATTIKFVMALTAEAELAALFIAACEMVPYRQTLINIGWPQPHSPVKTNNSTAIGVTNKTIIVKRAKMMDIRL